MQAHYDKERELALQESKQTQDMWTGYLDRLDKPGASLRVLRFVLATTEDPALKRWAAEQLQAEELARSTTEQVDKLALDLHEQDQRFTSAQAALESAQTDRDRRAAQSNLDKLREQKIEMEQRIQAAKAAAEKAQRATEMHLSKECLENPLAKGCS